MSFLDEINKYDPNWVLEQIEDKKNIDVERALLREHPRTEDLMALLSPAAEDYIEEIASRAHRTTVQRFGRTILLYAPIYLSNECTNGCLYCGFSAHNKIHRRTLSLDEVEKEAEYLHSQGFRHVILLTGEALHAADNSLILAAANRIRHLFSSISIEVYPMEVEEYQQTITAGVDGLTIYQETYDKRLYAEMHPFGKKRDYNYRILTPERAGKAGMRRIGIGTLLGIGNFRSEGFFTCLHAMYLARHYWQTQLSVSFPRIRPADGGFNPLNPVSDRHFVQLICALRLMFPDVGLVLSTRESAQLRDDLLPLGITQMSAGSCTAPGGYQGKDSGAQQFTIDDSRTPEEMCVLIRSKGYDAVWKDWDRAFLDKIAV